MKLIKAKSTDTDLIMQFIEQARERLRQKGIDQWQGEYPNVQSIINDIENDTAYLISANGVAVGYVCIDFGGEEAYNTDTAKWLTDGAYAVIHRIAVGEAYLSKGYAQSAFLLAEELCKQKSVFSIRIDTHEDNETMKHLLLKLAYQYCGNVYYPQGARIAFEKVLF